MDRKLKKELKKKAKLEKFNKKLENKEQPKQNRYKIHTKIVDDTVPGEKKNLSVMPQSYDPEYIEKSWYEWWCKMGFFKPDYFNDDDKNRDTFVILMPPPNITGKLHIGHSMMISIQDSIVRFKRMHGCKVLYLPGTDHAGISTQTVIEKHLWKQKKIRRNDMIREEFLKEAWKWRKNYGDTILEQIKRLGASCDFDYLKFTLDNEINRAVNESFNVLYEKGLIYRENKLVNWCAKLGTTISDLEIENIPVTPFMKHVVDDGEYKFGILYYIRYPIKSENSSEFVEIATTRPETILGDTAICANPYDKRYSHLKGRFAINPITNKEIPIIFDVKADPKFGTGVLKVTPGHDQDDYELGKKYNLEIISIFDSKNIVVIDSPYKGLKRYEARKKIVEYFKTANLLIKMEGYEHSLPICSRSGDIIEPMLKRQWFLRCEGMAKKALEIVTSGRIQIKPPEAIKTWIHWLSNPQDWCLSRQLWWGHQIPAYRVYQDEKEIGWVVGRDIVEAEIKAKKLYGDNSYKIIQDEDVLDTWFSSGILPFAVFNWPDDTCDLLKYFPTSLLETGSDILFFWVARMVMLSIELTGSPPFNEILLHGIVRDAHGRKMSKSLGNVIDPLYVIEGITSQDLKESLYKGNLDEKEIEKAHQAQKKDFPNGIPICGSDALRFTLLSYTNGLKDINMNILHVEGYRRFCNKIWNAFKFVKKTVMEKKLTKVDIFTFKKRYMSDSLNHRISNLAIDAISHDPAIEWLLSCRNSLIKNVENFMNTYNFLGATREVHNFILYTFCDVYIELIKKKHTADMLSCLYLVFLDTMKILHPFMPFITEEIYQRMELEICELDVSIVVSKFPEISLRELKDDYQMVPKMIKIIRSILDGEHIKRCGIQTNYPKEFICDVPFLCDRVRDMRVVTEVKGDLIDRVGEY